MNKTNLAITKCTELANMVLAQTKEDEINQQDALEIAVLQTQKIQALEARLEQQLANIATNGKDLHKQAATINNKMGGVYTNCHFITLFE